MVRFATRTTPASVHRRRLLDGMARSLVKRGFEATTIADIAAEARVSKRTYYEHFLSKQEGLVALYQRGYKECLDGMRRAADEAPEGADRLEAAIRAMFEHFRVNAPRAKAVLLGILSLGEQGLSIRDEGQRELAALLAGCLDPSLPEGPVPALNGLIGVVNDWPLQAFVNGTENELPGRAGQAAAIIRASWAAAQAQGASAS